LTERENELRLRLLIAGADLNGDDHVARVQEFQPAVDVVEAP
jgi:hypothetical protein